MIFQTIKSFLIAASAEPTEINHSIIVIALVFLFIAATIIGGVVSFKVKMKKFKENEKSDAHEIPEKEV